jgi:hypothetical protein
MKKLLVIALKMLVLSAVSCDKQKDDLVTPLTSEEFPQVFKFDDEGDGDLEDEDKFGVVITLADRQDPTGADLGGKVIPLDAEVTISFEVSEFEGFAAISNYIKDVSAFYEVDDCNEADVPVTFNTTTGKGTVTFPRGVEEIEIEFETNDALFDDDILNTADRFISFKMTGITGGQNVTFNGEGEFKYEVLDDEGIHGEWELDASDPIMFARFKSLFGLISEKVNDLEASEVDKIVISVEYDEVKVEIELTETETITECGSTEVVNKVIEIEAGIEELDLQSFDGEIEFADDLEQENGTEKEFIYKGSFEIAGKVLMIKLEGEYDDNNTGEIMLVLEK